MPVNVPCFLTAGFANVRMPRVRLRKSGRARKPRCGTAPSEALSVCRREKASLLGEDESEEDDEDEEEGENDDDEYGSVFCCVGVCGVCGCVDGVCEEELRSEVFDCVEFVFCVCADESAGADASAGAEINSTESESMSESELASACDLFLVFMYCECC